MNELLKINYGADRVTLSARELHSFLEIGTKFNDWFPRMCEYGFEENRDFRSILSKSTGGRPSTDYEITLDMAKELAMIQRSAKGKEARKYFIEVEKKWNSPEYVMNRALEISRKKVEQLMLENQEMKPKADYFDTLVERNLLTNLRDTAKELQIAPKTFNAYLLEDGYIYRDQRGALKPYQEHVKSGLFELKEYASRYNSHSGVQLMVTPKGRETFRLLYKEDIVL